MRTEPTRREQITAFIAAAIAFVIMVAPVWVEAGQTIEGRATKATAWADQKCFEGLGTNLREVPCDSEGFDIHTRAVQQAEEYMALVNKITAERDKSRELLAQAMGVVKQLMEQKAGLAGELAASEHRLINAKHDLGQANLDLNIKNWMITFLVCIIAVFVFAAAWGRRSDKPDVPFFSSWFPNKSDSSWFKRDLVVKPTIKEDK